jgi:hypothetical protein
VFPIDAALEIPSLAPAIHFLHTRNKEIPILQILQALGNSNLVWIYYDIFKVRIDLTFNIKCEQHERGKP